MCRITKQTDPLANQTKCIHELKERERERGGEKKRGERESCRDIERVDEKKREGVRES